MSALLLLPVLLACAAPATTAAEHPDRVFIFALKGDGVDERLLRLSERAIIQAADDAGLDPVSSQDLTAMLDIEATRQANGCEGDTACIAEIAGGLGAQRVVTGTLTRLPDGHIDVALTLFDHGGTSVAGRAEATARGDGELKAASLLAGQRLFGLADDDAPTSLRPVLLGVGGVTTAVGLAGLVGLWPLVVALDHQADARAAADAFADSGRASDFDELGRAHADYTREAAAWNSWGVGAVAVGGVVATAGVVVLVVGATAE